MSECKRIFLLGHPGAGKTLVAKNLSERLGWKFIDADLGLESRIGLSINDILGHSTEDFFECQCRFFKQITEQQNIVVTTDASVVCYEKLQEILSLEFTVYLEVSLAIQLERTWPKAETLLAIDHASFFQDLHESRDKLYEKLATMKISSDDNQVDEHVTEIIEFISPIKAEKIFSPEEKDLVFFHKTLHIPIKLGIQQALSLKYLAQGMSAKEIAREMHISYRTVEGTLAKVMEILGCTSSKELIALYHAKP